MTEENRLMLDGKSVLDLPRNKIFHPFGVSNNVTIDAWMNNFFFVFSQKLLIVEKRFTAFSADIKKMLLMKMTLQQFIKYKIT